MRVLVTGAGGFIGRTLIRTAPDNIELVALFGPGDTVTEENKLSRFAAGDITNSNLLSELIPECEAVIHLAGSASVAQSFTDPHRTITDHAVGASVVSYAAQNSGVRRIIHVSSAEVYGRPAENPVKECAITAPRSPYAAAKLAAESIFSSFSRFNDAEVIILRPFSIYGPGQRSQSLLDRIFRQALNNTPMTLFDLSPCRDYLHVDDLADALWSSISIDSPSGEPVIINLSSGTGTTVNELAIRVLELTGRKGESVDEQGIDRKTVADIPTLIGCPDLAHQLLDWRAGIDLHSGLAKTLEFYQSNTTP